MRADGLARVLPVDMLVAGVVLEGSLQSINVC